MADSNRLPVSNQVVSTISNFFQRLLDELKYETLERDDNWHVIMNRPRGLLRMEHYPSQTQSYYNPADTIPLAVSYTNGCDCNDVKLVVMHHEKINQFFIDVTQPAY